MAPDRRGRALGHFITDDSLEANQLKLATEHFPLPCSLRELVLDRYDDSPAPVDAAHRMEPKELLTYIRNIDDFEKSPWHAVMAQIEAIGDPTIPDKEHTALLRWLGQAFDTWQEQFPLEEPLATEMQRLKPALAAAIISDPDFLQPGLHPLHKLIDAIQSRAIGWQSRLDRVGTMLQQQITRAIEGCDEWLKNGNADLVAVYEEFATAATRDQSRAERMVQRVVETEVGKVKTAAAKREAALMINGLLEQYLAPEEFSDFLKGPWYSSAQLLLLKFGRESEQWQKMTETTETLLDSVQNLDEAEEDRRQYIFDVVTRLPKEMRRWLLSLHHDTEAVNEAMGLVEFAHLRILRRQSMELAQIAPIPIADNIRTTDEPKDLIALTHWQEGQWFIIDNPEQGVMRMQLALKADQEQQLLFTNLAGIKVLQIDYVAFNQLATQNKVTPLFNGASFSLCLSNAAGIKSAEMLEALVHSQSDVTPRKAPAPDEQPAQRAESSSTAELEEPHTEAEQVNTEETSDTDFLEQESDDDLHIESEPASEQTAEKDPVVEDGTDDVIVDAITDAIDEPQCDSPPDLTNEERSIVPAAQDAEATKQPGSGTGFLSDQVEEIKARGGFSRPAPEDPQEENLSTGTNDNFLSDQADSLDSHMVDQESPPAETAVTGEDFLGDLEDFDGTLAMSVQPQAAVNADATPEEDTSKEIEINLPTGTWLGFHDGETPMMARLAVHDPDEDHYIFVNRKGVKLRKISGQELLDLIESDLIDILETKTNFRDEVNRARNSLDD